eukprot:m.118355 g.118355  ORF g.118355 m.118355 type:complete len:304 (-) comp15563_c0_seq24:949-1860(-)
MRYFTVTWFERKSCYHVSCQIDTVDTCSLPPVDQLMLVLASIPTHGSPCMSMLLSKISRLYIVRFVAQSGSHPVRPTCPLCEPNSQCNRNSETCRNDNSDIFCVFCSIQRLYFIFRPNHLTLAASSPTCTSKPKSWLLAMLQPALMPSFWSSWALSSSSYKLGLLCLKREGSVPKTRPTSLSRTYTTSSLAPLPTSSSAGPSATVLMKATLLAILDLLWKGLTDATMPCSSSSIPLRPPQLPLCPELVQSGLASQLTCSTRLSSLDSSTLLLSIGPGLAILGSPMEMMKAMATPTLLALELYT